MIIINNNDDTFMGRPCAILNIELIFLKCVSASIEIIQPFAKSTKKQKLAVIHMSFKEKIIQKIFIFSKSFKRNRTKTIILK